VKQFDFCTYRILHLNIFVMFVMNCTYNYMLYKIRIRSTIN